MTDFPSRIGRRIAMALGIGRLSHQTKEGKTPTLQIIFPGEEVRDGVPFLQHYGFASCPLPGADIVVNFQAGDRSRGVAIASNDQRFRPQDLKAGEVCLYHQSGSRLLLKTDGSIELIPANKKTAITGDVHVSGNIVSDSNITAKQDVKAGNISLINHRHISGEKNSPTGPSIA